MSVNVSVNAKIGVLKLLKAKNIKELKFGAAEGWVDLSAIKITILEIKKDTVTIQLSDEHDGKEFEIMREVVLNKGDSYGIYADDLFKAKRKIMIT